MNDIEQAPGLDRLNTLSAHHLELLSRYQITTTEALYGQYLADRKSLAELLAIGSVDLAELERELNGVVPEDTRLALGENPRIYLPSPLPVT